MSRNITFLILGLISGAWAYFLLPSLTDLVELIISDSLPGNIIRMMQHDDLVTFAGSISLFGLLFMLLYILIPVSYVWFQINSAITITRTMPEVSDLTRNTDKKTFLSALYERGVITRLARTYGAYLIQGPAQEVDPEILKNSRLIKKVSKKNKDQKHMIAPVLALSPAEVIFNGASLVGDNLLLGFFMVYARILVGAGLVCLGISAVSFSAGSGQDTFLLNAIQPGMTALLFCFSSAVIISALTRLVDQMLRQNSSRLARNINRLFFQGDWPQNKDLQAKNDAETVYMEKLGGILQASLDKPLKEISKAVDALTVDQEKKLDNILQKTLRIFADDQEKKSGKDAEILSKAIRDASLGAADMKKQFSNANALFTRQMNKQTTAIARHLMDMQKILTKSEKATQMGVEDIISKMAGEIESIHNRLGDFMDSRLNILSDKHKEIESAVKNKNGILVDLHNSAKDLGTISNASGMLLERFISLATELDAMLKNFQEMGLGHSAGDAERRDRLKSALSELKKANSDSIDSLPDM